jgi:TPR repeat protein
MSIDYIKNIENIELYIIVILAIFTIWFIFNTINYYHNQKRKIKHLHTFAKDGDLESQTELANRYLKGKQVKKDCKKAAFWYQKAAFSGNEFAKIRFKKFLMKQDSKNKCK